MVCLHASARRLPGDLSIARLAWDYFSPQRVGAKEWRDGVLCGTIWLRKVSRTFRGNTFKLEKDAADTYFTTFNKTSGNREYFYCGSRAWVMVWKHLTEQTQLMVTDVRNNKSVTYVVDNSTLCRGEKVGAPEPSHRASSGSWVRCT